MDDPISCSTTMFFPSRIKYLLVLDDLEPLICSSYKCGPQSEQIRQFFCPAKLPTRFPAKLSAPKKRHTLIEQDSPTDIKNSRRSTKEKCKKFDKTRQPVGLHESPIGEISKIAQEYTSP
ncbi:hypothetical protein HUJ04_011597 [Dendroctonus ponderosae]|nr:hypothetical protein HUJ04_011597 [Dendroctonus ponderosae]